MITAPGVYEGIGEAEYHADPCPEPSLSCSLIDILLERSPAHAYAAHPRFTPQPINEHQHNTGTVVHNLLLGGRDLVPIAAPTYQGKDAKSARDAALLAGLLPVLEHQLAEAHEIADAILKQFDRHPLLRGVLDPGTQREVTVAWQEEDGFWCRCRPDLLLSEERLVVDLKITGIPATPEIWGGRHAIGMGYHRRSAWYRRGLRKAAGFMPRYHFAAVENKPPYAVSVFECSDEAFELAVKEIAQALRIWGQCMKTGAWPGYSTELQWIVPPAWAHYQAEDRLARHEMGTINE